MNASVQSGSTLELARRLIDAGPGAPLDLDGEDWRKLAWNLKDLCYSAWSSEPQRAVKAADVLRTMCRDAGLGGSRKAPVDERLASEIEALAGWTTGIAQVTRGEMLA